jgi:O-antigen/teichoic acid export membrane protein
MPCLIIDFYSFICTILADAYQSYQIKQQAPVKKAVFKKLLYQHVFWRGLSLLSFFILNVAMARSFGAAASGNIFFIINFFALVLLAATLSMEAGLGYFAAKDKTAAAWPVLLSLVWTVIAALVIYVCLPLFQLNTNGQLRVNNFKELSFLYVAGYLLLVFFTALFSARQNFIVPNLVATLANMILLGMIVFSGAGNKAVEAGNFLGNYFTAFFVQGVLLLLLYTAMYVKQAAIQLPGPAQLKAIFRYSLQAFAANLVFFLVYRVDYWFVNYFCSDKELLGNYIQVSKIAQVFFILPGIVASTVFSVTAAGQKNAMSDTVLRLSRLIFSGAMVACALLAAAGYWLFPQLFGAGFDKMYIPFLLLMPGIIAIATLYPFTAYYAGKNRVPENIKGSLLALIVIISGDLLLVPLWGINGAALVSSAGYIAYEVYILRQFKKEYGITIKDCFIIKKEDWQQLSTLLKNKN